MSVILDHNKEKRMYKYEYKKELSLRLYNFIIFAILIYGFVINIALCTYIGNLIIYFNPLGIMIAYFVLALLGCFMATYSDNAIISFIGYNMVVVPVGVVLSICIRIYGGLTSPIVLTAFIITTCIVSVMAVIGLYKPKFCSKLGGLLFACLIGIVIAEIAMLLFGFKNTLISWISAIVFSLYIAYDVYYSQMLQPTLDNAVDSALNIYLDIINLFLNIVNISSKKK